MYVIYALIDPRDNNPHYIGLTTNVYSRFAQHLQCNSNNHRRDAWIQELMEANDMLLMVTLERVHDKKAAHIREAYWINHYLHLGISLYNNVIPSSEPVMRPPRTKRDPRITQDIQTEILALYREGYRRVDIQEKLKLNGDEYWMIKATCDEYDQEVRHAS